MGGWLGGGMCREKEPLRKPLAGSRAGLCRARGVSRLAGEMTEHVSPPFQGTSAGPGLDSPPTGPSRALGGGFGGHRVEPHSLASLGHMGAV